MGKWTTPGTENEKNRQVVVRSTGRPSDSHPYAFVYEMRCLECGGVYGANGCDIRFRKCPNCQKGAKGEPLG
jgi:hypothetical protein